MRPLHALARLAIPVLLIATVVSSRSSEPVESLASPCVTVDLNVGETTRVRLPRGRSVSVRVVDLKEHRDPFRNAVRRAEATIAVEGTELTLVSGCYRLPVSVAGVQVDCPVTGGFPQNSQRAVSGDANPWALDKSVRLRFWPGGAPWIQPGTFRYPAGQRWFAGSTQMSNEPSYVDGGEDPRSQSVYYHYGLDIGGAEGRVEVNAATDGEVMSAGLARLPGLEETPVRPRYDVVYVKDRRGWYYRYSHLFRIDGKISPGARVRIGQRIGLLGKEGGSGGWSHLHFDLFARQPSGRWGVMDGYAFLWDAYRREFRPELLAVARPHALVGVGERVTLDGSRSWSAQGLALRHEWSFADGTRGAGPLVERTYRKPGFYSEVLKVTDTEGRSEYDFAIVNVVDPRRLAELPPSLHPAYYPTTGLRPGQPVTFLVRTFNTTDGEETWDFGDGAPPVRTRSDGNVRMHDPEGYARTVHRYARAGHYLVRVERTNGRGETALGHLSVRVE